MDEQNANAQPTADPVAQTASAPASTPMASTAVGVMTPPAAPTVPAQQAAAPAVGSVEFAGFWIRFAAVIVDGVLLGIVYLPITFIVGIVMGPASVISYNSSSYTQTSAVFGANFFIAYVILLLIYAVYDWGMLLKFNGQTLGKKLVGVKVISADGQPLSLGQIILRELIGKIVSGLIFDLGYIWAGFDPQKQAWHDKIAKTFVVKAK